MEYMEYMDTLAHHLGTWNIFNYFSRYIHGTYMDIHGTRIFNLAMWLLVLAGFGWFWLVLAGCFDVFSVF